MKEQSLELKLRHRLILAGLKELEEHGVKDFSLRRVALNAEVSCAAPYRHFKDKEQLIGAIITYVKDGWDLLSNQIKQVFANDPKTLVIELSVAFVKFWIANGYFRSVLSLTEGNNDTTLNDVIKDFDKPIEDAIKNLYNQNPTSNTSNEQIAFNVLSLTYGAIMLINKNAYSTEQAISSLKTTLQKSL